MTLTPMKAIAPSFMDRALASVAPAFATRRYRARLALNMAGQYAGAKSKKSSLKAWLTTPGSADADALERIVAGNLGPGDVLRAAGGAAWRAAVEAWQRSAPVPGW